MTKHLILAITILIFQTVLIAQEHGHMVRFDNKINLDILVNRQQPALSNSGNTVYASPVSAAIETAFDRILFNGTLADTNMVLQISLQTNGVWSQWQNLKLHFHQGGRFWARHDINETSNAQMKYRFLSSGQGQASIKIYAVEAVLAPKEELKSELSPADGTRLYKVAQDTVSKPAIVTRAEWGAKAPIGQYFPHDPYRFAQHHTAGRRVATLAAGIAEQKFIQDFHQNGRGWQDIGYHFTIDDSGRIYQGVPPDFRGTHVGGNNTGNVGISYMGNFEISGELPTEKTVNTLKEMWSWLSFEYNVNPDSLFGHRDYKATACPGKNFYTRLPEMRNGVRNILGFGAPYVANPLPQPFTTEVEPGVLLSFTVRDDEEGVDPNSIIVKINGNAIATTIVPAANEYRVSFKPVLPFNSSQNVVIDVEAADLADPPNMLHYSYKFKVKVDFLYTEVITQSSIRNGNIEIDGDWTADLNDVSLSGLNNGQRLLATDTDNTHRLRIFPQVEETGDYIIFMAQQENTLGKSALYQLVNANGQSHSVFKEYNSVFRRGWGKLSPVPVHFDAGQTAGYIELSGSDGIETRLSADAFRLQKVDRLDNPIAPTFKYARVTNYQTKEIELAWYPSLEGDIAGYRLYMSADGRSWNEPLVSESELGQTVSNYTLNYEGAGTTAYFRLVSVDTNAVEIEGQEPEPLLSEPSDIYGVGLIESSRNLIVDNFDRLASWTKSSHPFVRSHGDALDANKYGFDSCTETVVQNGEIDLNSYDLVVYFCGDDSRSNEALAAADQQRLLTYLENGGNLFISGSELGYDFDATTSEELTRSRNLLKANYKGDLSGSNRVLGSAGTAFDGLDFIYGTVNSEDTYLEDFPDYISPLGGSSIALSYDNLRTAAIQYDGPYNNSPNNAKLIYIAFTFETIIDPADRSAFMGRAMQFFDLPTSVAVNTGGGLPKTFELAQNYPNPFNPTTTIRYAIPAHANNSSVKIEVFNTKGQRVNVLVNETQAAGNYTIAWNGKDQNGHKVASGIYVYRLKVGDFVESRKMTLLK